MKDHKTFMRIALAEAQKALDAGEFPVGCAIVADNEVVAVGHRVNSLNNSANELDHAEIVALRQLLAERPDIDRNSLIVYSTMEPCLMCYATLLLNGVRTIVYGYEDAMGGGTCLDLASLTPLYQQMQVEVVPHLLRDESLELFRRFFCSPDNNYWRDSLLADYTMKQAEKSRKPQDLP